MTDSECANQYGSTYWKSTGKVSGVLCENTLPIQKPSSKPIGSITNEFDPAISPEVKKGYYDYSGYPAKVGVLTNNYNNQTNSSNGSNISSSLQQLNTDLSQDGFVNRKLPTQKPPIYQTAFNEANDIKEWLKGFMYSTHYCVESNEGYWQRFGCIAGSSTFQTALENLKNGIGSFFSGMFKGLGESFSWWNLLIAVGTAILTAGVSPIWQLIIGIGSIVTLTISIFSSGQLEEFIRSNYLDKLHMIGYVTGYILGSVVLGGIATILADMTKTVTIAVARLTSTATSNLGKNLTKLWAGQTIGSIPLIVLERDGSLVYRRFELFSFLKNSSDDIVQSTLGQLDDDGFKASFSEYIQINKIKANLNNLIRYTQRDSKYIWLETGNESAGKIHIFDTPKSLGGLTRYEQLLKDGVVKNQDELYDLIFKIVNNGNKISEGCSLLVPNGSGVLRNITVVVGNNGYIVTITY